MARTVSKAAASAGSGTVPATRSSVRGAEVLVAMPVEAVLLLVAPVAVPVVPDRSDEDAPVPIRPCRCPRNTSRCRVRR
ncbi:hypothetical protein STAL104432_04970 [Streptomyces albus]